MSTETSLNYLIQLYYVILANGDYNPVVTVLTFDQAINRACFNVTTVEDQTLEKTTEPRSQYLG